MSAEKITTTDLLAPSVVLALMRRQTEPVDAISVPLSKWAMHCRDEGGGIGLARGWYVVIGGGTGHGKSLLALNIAAHAMGQGVNPAFLSLEMSHTQLATRLYSIVSGVQVRALERGDTHDTLLAERATAEIEHFRDRTGAAFYVNREPISDLTDVVTVMQRFIQEYGVRLLILDYLQLVGYGDEQEMYRAVTTVSRTVRALAQSQRVTVVALSQYNRATSVNRTVPPMAQSLIGSSSLENDADQVLLLDHSRYVRSETGNTAKTWAILAKNRHGSTGQIPIEWDYRTLRVREALPDEESSWPQRM